MLFSVVRTLIYSNVVRMKNAQQLQTNLLLNIRVLQNYKTKKKTESMVPLR